MVAAGLDARRTLLASSAPATTGGPSTSPASRRSSPAPGSTRRPGEHADAAARQRRRRRRCARAERPSVDPAELQRQARRDAGDRASSTAGRRPATSMPTTRCSGDRRRPRDASPDAVEHVGVDGCGAPAPAVLARSGWRRAVRALAVDGHAVHRAMTRVPRDGRRADPRRHRADAARPRPDGQGRRRGRVGRRAARRSGGGAQDRRRRRAGPHAGDGRGAALARRRRCGRRPDASRCSATAGRWAPSVRSSVTP